MHGARAQPELPDIGRYTISAELGRGGMGVVYRAYEPALERAIALKVLSPSLAHQAGFVTRLHREAISIARLRHPNIALLYEFGHAEGTPFLAMEYVPGLSLRQLLECGPLPHARALHILAQTGEALDYAHGLGIVHRDVKPSNILVDGADRAVLIDFGLATTDEHSLLTADGAVLGTPHYMAPEQADGRGASAASDQYSLAVVAYEMLAGSAPFVGRSATAVIYAHIHELPPPPSERQPALPTAVDAVLLRALAKAPHERYPSLAAFVAALREALAPPARPARPARGRWWPSAAVGLAVALVALLALFLRGAIATSPQMPASARPHGGVPLPQQIVWQRAFRLSGGAAPTLLGDTLLVDTLDGTLVALSAGSGEVRWQQDSIGGRRVTFGAPQAGSALVFVGTDEEEVLGLSLASGGLIWRRSVQGVVQQQPTLYRDQLVVATEKGYLYLLRAGSGQVIWGRPMGLGLGPPMASNEQIFIGAGTRLSALDIASGTVSWEFEAASVLTTRPTVLGDLILVGTERGVLHALRGSDGQEQWRAQFSGALGAAPAVGDAIFVADRSGGVTALNQDGRRVRWYFDAAAAINATPLLADGKLFFGAGNGVFYALDARDGRELSRIQLGGSVESPSVLGEGLIYVRADQVYALGQR